MSPILERYLIWSYEHGMWWKAASRGYTRTRAEAGRYSWKEAEEICANANSHIIRPGPLNEISVAESDLASFTADLPAPHREDAAGERTSFALAAELLATAEWIAERTASPGNQRRLDVLQRAIGFLRGDSRGELIDVRYLIRNDAACAAIAAHVRTEEIARHAAALSTAEREQEALRMRVRRLETALVDHAASGAEIERAVKTFRSFESRRSDFAAMLEVLDEYERNRLTREARPNATRPFPWRAVVNGPDDAQVVCGEHGNPSTFAQIAECHTAADAEFIVQACNAAARAGGE